MSLKAKLQFCVSPVGRYIVLGWALLRLRHAPVDLFRSVVSSFKRLINQPAFALSGAMMAISIGTVGQPTSFTSQTPLSVRQQQQAVASQPVSILHDGTGKPADLQGIPEAIQHPPGSNANRYARGNCTWYVASRRAVPGNWGNARTWLPRARAAGYATGSVPVPGAIAWTSAGYYGHVAYVEAVNGGNVLVSEMNYRGLYLTDQRWAPISAFQYIY